jgi:outer membrane protein TolC
MKSRLAAFCLAVLLLPALAVGQPAPRTFTERLSLETAVRLAVEHNRQLLNADLQVEQAEDALAIVRTRRLPTFQTEMSMSQLVTPVNFSFPRGAFGEFPGTGPIPATDTNVSVSRQPTAYVSSQISQPISKLFEIGVSIRSAAASRDIAQEHARAEQLALVNQVKRLYFAILQTESALDADEEAIALYRELDRTLQMRVAQQVALRADALDVRVQLARAELAKTTRENGLASQKEQLNQLLGRDVRTDFEVETVSAVSILDVDLRAAQARALESRADVREAQLRLERADLDRRLAAADWIPEVSLAASYISNFNVDMLPRNLATVGLTAKWEPFDWGRKGHEVASRTRAVQQARHNVRDAEDRALLEINSRFRTLAEKRALLAVAEMAQGAAREKLRVKTNQFQVQAVLLTDVLQLRAEVADVDDRYQQALLAFWTAKADFEHAVGEDIV